MREENQSSHIALVVMQCRYIVIRLFCLLVCLMIGGSILDAGHLFNRVYEPITTKEVMRKPQPITERTNIFFLKTHKCASSTVQNILMRFGLERHLTFVLPDHRNYLGHPDPFTEKMIDTSIATASGKYNIFAHHTRYSKKGVDAVLYRDAQFVTILRHPALVYESLFHYVEFEEWLKVNFTTLLKSPDSVSLINHRKFDRYGLNQMSFDLGFPVEEFNSLHKVAEFVKKIDAEFDLVMMSEWMEASLVLLADLMNWPLKNVVSLKLNSRRSHVIYRMSEDNKKRLVELNSVDYALYKHFIEKFRRRIREYGKERMKSNVEKLLLLNSKLYDRCVKSVNNKGFKETQSYTVRDSSDRLCVLSAKNELDFTQDLWNIQKHKLNVVAKLRDLLDRE